MEFVQKNGFKLTDKSGNHIPPECLQGKVVGFYFSARWCPPCRAFTPKLKQFYEDVKREGADFEIVFVPSDETVEEAKSYFVNDHGSWLMVDFDNRTKVASSFAFAGIPTFIIIDSAGNAVVPNAREAVVGNGDGDAMQVFDDFKAGRSRDHAETSVLCQLVVRLLICGLGWHAVNSCAKSMPSSLWSGETKSTLNSPCGKIFSVMRYTVLLNSWLIAMGAVVLVTKLFCAAGTCGHFTGNCAERAAKISLFGLATCSLVGIWFVFTASDETQQCDELYRVAWWVYLGDLLVACGCLRCGLCCGMYLFLGAVAAASALGETDGHTAMLQDGTSSGTSSSSETNE